MKKNLPVLALCAATMMAAPSYAAELLWPQNRGAFYSDEAIEIAVADLPAGRKAQVEFVPDKGARTLTFPVTGQGPTVTAVLPLRALAPGEYSIRLDGKDAGKLSIASGVLSSTMLTSQAAGANRALLQFAWSPFYDGFDALCISATDEAGLQAGISALAKLK